MHFLNHADHEKLDNLKIITSCCTGDIIPLERLANDVLSSMILGDGFCVVLEANEIVFPVSGVVKDISVSGSEVTVKSDDNLIVLISVSTEPGGFLSDIKPMISPGDRVERGDVIWNVDIEQFKSSGQQVVASVIVTNSSTLSSFNINYGHVKNTDQPVMTITM